MPTSDDGTSLFLKKSSDQVCVLITDFKQETQQETEQIPLVKAALYQQQQKKREIPAAIEDCFCIEGIFLHLNVFYHLLARAKIIHWRA